jgi:hypothetical protein
LQGEDGDFGGAVEAKGNAYGADAAVDVELQLTEAEEAFGVFFAHGRKDEGGHEGQANLAAVGVAGEDDVDETASGMLENGVGVVGLVRHENDGAVGVWGDGELEVGGGGAGVVDGAEPEPGAVAFDGEVLIDEDGDAVGGKGLDDEWSADGGVVVAEAGIAQGAGEGAEDFAAAVGGGAGGDEGEGALGDEVSGEQDHVGGEGVDVADDALEKEGLGKLVEVDVADLGDAEAVKGAGKIGDGEGAGDEVDLVAGDFTGVEGESCCSGSCSDEKVAAGNAGGLRGRSAGHSP